MLSSNDLPSKQISANISKRFLKISKEFRIYHILHELLKVRDEGLSGIQLANKLSIPAPTVYYYLKKLVKQGFVAKKGYGVYEITEKGIQHFCEHLSKFSLGVSEKPQIDLHALTIELPILKDNPEATFWDYEQEMKNWIAKHKRIARPLGITLRKTTKHIYIYLWQRTLENPLDLMPLIMKAVIYTSHYLQEKGILVDILEAKTKTLHLAVKDPFLEKTVPKSVSVTVELGREAKQILDSDKPEQAKAWTDSSPFRGIETNDVEYLTNYILMPENVKRNLEENRELRRTIEETLTPAVNELARQIRLHLAVQRKQLENLEKFDHRLEELRDVVKLLCYVVGGDRVKQFFKPYYDPSAPGLWKWIKKKEVRVWN